MNAQLPADCKVIVVHVDGLIGSEPLFDRQVAAVPMLVHHSVVYVGNGAARRAGIARASGDIVIVQHGDLEYDPGVTTAS